MRIGVMLRTLDELGGIGMYTRYLIRELLELDKKNHYFLFYRNPENLGRFADRINVKEINIRPYNKILWDQVGVPLACLREKIDIIFHPKFTVPLFSPCKSVMVLHGADWFIPEHAQYYNKWDVRYIKLFMPLYCRKAAFIFSVSQLTTNNFIKILNVPPDKIKTVYFGPAKFFKKIENEKILNKVKQHYHLPDRYIFSLSKYGLGGGNRKNIENIFKAYKILHQQSSSPPKLVIGGKDCDKYRSEYRVPNEGYGADILFTGFIEQKNLPAIYSEAEVYLYPSNVEAFPIPLTEAMACGTPIVTSNVNGLREIAGDAALFVDQHNPTEIADAMMKVLGDFELRKFLSKRGLQRSKTFDWGKCAKETLEIVESLIVENHVKDSM
jgi:glycosyltransferase involved in cell wall biosynthesis